MQRVYCKSLWAIICAIIVSSCANRKTVGQDRDNNSFFKYAQLLKIEQHPDHKLVKILDPWENGAVLHQYALIEEGQQTPTNLPKGTDILHIPLQRLCIGTTVHANLLYTLGAQRNISTLCDVNYIQNQDLIRMVKDQRIQNAGSAMNPSIETIMHSQAQALMFSPFEGTNYGILEKAGIPIIECADYMETSALGRAEWMKFYGMLVGKEKEADSLFLTIESEYLKLAQQARKQTKRPKLLVDRLNGPTWYLPGGASIYGALFRDAGAQYTVANPQKTGTEALSLEKVMTTALDADIWLIKYGQETEITYQSLAKDNEAYTHFEAYKKRRIYSCNTMNVDFYDIAPFRPDLLLKDIVKILHPTLLKDHQLHFYTPLR